MGLSGAAVEREDLIDMVTRQVEAEVCEVVALRRIYLANISRELVN